MVGGLTPGPAVALVMASSFRYGIKPSMLAAFGIASANALWVLLAASGAMALFTRAPSAFIAMKFIGFLVILYLAITTVFGPLPNLAAQTSYPDQSSLKPQADLGLQPVSSKGKLYRRGLILQISSPMPLVYFGGLLPAYFDIERPMLTQILIMFATVTLTELIGLWIYAAGAHNIRATLRSPVAARAFNIIIGLMMLASGTWAIFLTT